MMTWRTILVTMLALASTFAAVPSQAAVTLQMSGVFVRMPLIDPQTGTLAVRAAFEVGVPTPWSVEMTLDSRGHNYEWAVRSWCLNIADRQFCDETAQDSVARRPRFSAEVDFILRNDDDYLPTLPGNERIFFLASFDSPTYNFKPFNAEAEYLNNVRFAAFTIGKADDTGSVYYFTDDKPQISVSIDGTFVGKGGVPEPQTWAIMLLGFAAIGASLRRGAVTKA
jgi:hypothetical protein